MALPLEGLRVLDCSRVLAGPFATMLLGDLGADVIKLEPPDGDESRAWGPPFWGEPMERRSAYFASVNRNKRSIVVDLRTDGGRALLDRLADGSDLLVHNYRPATASRLGVDHARLAERHPRLVVAMVGGFPGRDADRPAYDLLAQAVSGLMAVTGEPHGPPTKVGVAVLDLIAGLELATVSLAALVGRGRVRAVEVGLIESGVISLVNVLGGVLATGEEAERHGNAHPNIVPYQAFAARDGHLVIAVGNDRQFRSLIEVLGVADADGRYATNPDRVARRDELVPLIAHKARDRGRDELVAALTAADVPAAPVNSVSEALALMRESADGSWTEDLDGVTSAPASFLLDESRATLRRAPPRLGEHTDEVLGELSFSPDEIAELRAAGVVA